MRTHLLVLVAVSLAGCAGNATLTGARSGGAKPKLCFWPPPRSTSLWTAETNQPLRDMSLADVGGDLAVALRRRGYLQQHWFPIGAGFVHGFAVTTRLEQLDDDGSRPRSERWMAWQPEPANLFWLSEAMSVRLPRPGQYRVFLAAFTDLPIGATKTAPTWGPDTVMAGPEIPETLSATDLPRERYLKSGRLGVYVYVYERNLGDDDGRLAANEAPQQPEAQRSRPPAWLTDGLTSTPWHERLSR